MDREPEFSLNEMLAFCVRKGKIILIAAAVFALLLGVYQYRSQVNAMTDEAVRILQLDSAEELKSLDNWDEKMRSALEQSYMEDLTEYNEASENYDRRISDYENKIVGINEYIDNSLLMRIDACNEYVTTVYIDISSIGASVYEPTIEQTADSPDYVPSEISVQYASLWSRIQLQQALGIAEYSDTEDKYLRELISLDSIGDGMLCISAVGSSADMSQSLADAAYAYLLSQSEAVTKLSCAHKLLPISCDTKLVIDQGLSSKQIIAMNSVEDYETMIDTIKVDKRGLTVPVNPTNNIYKRTVLFSVIGAFFGVLFVCILVIVKSLVCVQLESSAQLEKLFALPQFGALPKHRSVFERCADSLMGERSWDDEKQALLYMVEKGKLLCKEHNVLLLLSTVAMEAECVDTVRRAFSEAGKTVEFADDPDHNPAALDALRRCDGVILVERLRHNKLSEIEAALSLAGKAEKSVLGFVLL